MMNSILKKIAVLFSFFLLFGTEGFSQDAIFSQFYSNPLYLNPAFAGSAVCPRLILNYRNQWPSIAGTFVTYNASYDLYINPISGGVGVLFTSDQSGEGALTTTMISGMYAYNLKVSEKFSIRTALQATYMQKKIDWDNLTFGDQIDPRYGFVYNTQETRPSNDKLNKGFADFSAGILGYSDHLFFGVSANHLTEPDEGYIGVSKLPMKFTAHAGANIRLDNIQDESKRSKLSISPNLLYQHQLDFDQLNYGFYVNTYPFVGGLWFRQNFENPDALIVLVGIEQARFKFGYSYDITVSKLSNVTGGAHEFSFAWHFNCPEKRMRVKAIKCPSF